MSHRTRERKRSGGNAGLVAIGVIVAGAAAYLVYTVVSGGSGSDVTSDASSYLYGTRAIDVT